MAQLQSIMLDPERPSSAAAADVSDSLRLSAPIASFRLVLGGVVAEVWFDSPPRESTIID
eukprot:m.442836 g.442836  ORF g.442836 m.442836 type:complete len:60 (-) comp18865_c0_seq1:1659-1838(-)